MTEGDKAKRQPNSRSYIRLIGAVKRMEDGAFSVFPYDHDHDGYLLTAEQIPTFERWFIELNELNLPSHKYILKKSLAGML